MRVSVDDASVAATRGSDRQGTPFYQMRFGDWFKVTLQLQHVDEFDGNKVKNAVFGRNSVGPVVFDVWQRELPKLVTSLKGEGASSTYTYPV